MEAILIEDYSFAYPNPGKDEPGVYVLDKVSLGFEEGGMYLLCGQTGCGKSTLLRACKPELAPVGKACGSISVLGREIVRDGARVEAFSPEESASLIGFVMQDPGAQIICDTVWHELAFGLENLGTPQDQMRRRVAEIAHFFGIEPWMNDSTEGLSGGQKQLLNLAATLVMRPSILLLDEPTAMLDPNARRQFVDMLARVNDELGITVVVATHSPEEFSRYKTKTVVLGDALLNPESRPVVDDSRSSRLDRDPAICIREAFFRYDKAKPFILRNLSVRVAKGTVHAFVGGNGCGKSTLLKCMSGICKLQRGSISNKVSASQAMLPQDPKALLVCDTVMEELCEWKGRIGYSDQDIQGMLDGFQLNGCEARHPYDLSGGQRQKLALAKILLCNPSLLFLDEPTKGLDALSASEMALIVRRLAKEGKTIVLVTHDLDFASLVADDVSMMFDGELACTEPAHDFFVNNIVYAPQRECRLYAGYAKLIGQQAQEA